MDVEFRRQEIQVAIARAAELRALHAALLPGGHAAGTSSAVRLSDGASPSPSRASRQLFSAEDYPLFAPSNREETLSPYHYLHSRNHSFLESSSRSRLERNEENRKQDLSDVKKEIKSSPMHSAHPIISSTADDGQKLQPNLCRNHVDLQQPLMPEESKLVIACNRCRPASISRVADFEQNNNNNRNASQMHQKKIGAVLSRLICPRFRRKPKSKKSPNKRLEHDDHNKPEAAKNPEVMCSVERVMKELIGATENRDAASAEVGEMGSSLQELREKLAHLEAHCEELKTALKQALMPVGKHAKSTEIKKHDLSTRTKSSGSSSTDCSMPVLNREVMLEGFLQIAAEARLAVTQFCNTLIDQTREADHVGSLEKLDAGCRPGSKGLILQYHLESLVNQILYRDFENCVFQRDGAQKILNPQECRLENFSTFVALRSLSWKEALKKGSRGYSEDLSRFCDQKMSSVVSSLDWLGRPWPEQLRQAFFVAAKCVWLLHLLAFSFSPPAPVILRVEENRGFDPRYMEDVRSDRRRLVQAQDHVEVMVVPGFYVQDRVVIRCKVV